MHVQKLLIVDDEPNLLYSLRKALQTDSLRVDTAATAQQGIDRVRAGHPDAVILDVRLPDMSGLDAFNVIRQIDPRLPVIIVTAYTTTETAIEAMKRGAYEYLLKPVDLDRLGEVVAPQATLSACLGPTSSNAATARSTSAALWIWNAASASTISASAPSTRGCAPDGRCDSSGHRSSIAWTRPSGTRNRSRGGAGRSAWR